MALNYGYPNTRPSLILDFVNSQSVDPRITFTRASTATYFDQNGVLRTANPDEPRIDYDPTTRECKGLLIEEQRTNLLLYSEALENWSNASGRATLTDKYYSGSIRYREVKKTNSAPNESITSHVINYESETYYVLTVVLRAGTSNKCDVGVYSFSLGWQYNDPTNGEVSIVYGPGTFTKEGASLVHVYDLSPDADTMIQIKVKFSDTNAGRVYVYPGGITSTIPVDSNLVTRVQFEKGDFPTSYIPTNGTQVARAADIAVMTGTNFSSWYRQDEGTFFVDASVDTFSKNSIKEHRALFVKYSAVQNFNLRSYSNGAGNLYIDATSHVNSASVANFFGFIYSSSPASFKEALSYDANSFSFSANGSIEVDNNISLPVGLDSMIIGSTNIHIKRIAYWSKRLPNETLQTLTV